MLATVILGIYTLIILLTLYSFSRIDNGIHPSDNLVTELPRVSVIVPARNEEGNIRRCLQSLTNQDYPDFEIIVVDGDSEDRTREIVREQFPRVSLIEEPPRPEGWVGKPWACHVGFKHASGDVLLFTDADTFHQRESLKVLVSTLIQKSNGFLTTVTKIEMKKFWEYTLIFIFQIIALSLQGARGSDGKHLANGQYMMFTRNAYKAIGGHERVKSSVIEDMELATAGAQSGIPPLACFATHLVSVRMYTTFDDLIEGFSKNMALGTQRLALSSMIRVNALFLWIAGIFILPVTAYYFPVDRPYYLWALLISFVLYTSIAIFGEKQLTGEVTYHPVLFPIYFAIVTYIILKSMTLVYVKKEVKWKGRAYKV